MQTASQVLELSPVIPVVALEDADHAVPLGRALARGGLRTIEITLRTPAGLPSIERLAAEVPEITVGAGTITPTPRCPTRLAVPRHGRMFS